MKNSQSFFESSNIKTPLDRLLPDIQYILLIAKSFRRCVEELENLRDNKNQLVLVRIIGYSNAVIKNYEMLRKKKNLENTKEENFLLDNIDKIMEATVFIRPYVLRYVEIFHSFAEEVLSIYKVLPRNLQQLKVFSDNSIEEVIRDNIHQIKSIKAIKWVDNTEVYEIYNIVKTFEKCQSNIFKALNILRVYHADLARSAEMMLEEKLKALKAAPTIQGYPSLTSCVVKNHKILDDYCSKSLKEVFDCPHEDLEKLLSPEKTEILKDFVRIFNAGLMIAEAHDRIDDPKLDSNELKVMP